MASEIRVSTNKETSQPSGALSQQQVASSKPEVTIQLGSHLDPGAYIRGKYPITIGQNVLIHPRAHLLSIHSPLMIGDGCVISEKCVLGGPLPATPQPDQVSDNTDSGHDLESDEEDISKATIIEDFVHLHPNVTVHRGALIKAATVVESNTVIEENVVVGSHSKLCSMLTVTDTVPDWTVLWGSNRELKRRDRTAHLDGPIKDGYKLVENERIKAMQREKEGTIAVLRAAASKTLTSGGRSKK